MLLKGRVSKFFIIWSALMSLFGAGGNIYAENYKMLECSTQPKIGVRLKNNQKFREKIEIITKKTHKKIPRIKKFVRYYNNVAKNMLKAIEETGKIEGEGKASN